MVVVVLVLKVLTNYVGIDEEDTMGSSVRSLDSVTYEKNCLFINGKYLE